MSTPRKAAAARPSRRRYQGERVTRARKTGPEIVTVRCQVPHCFGLYRDRTDRERRGTCPHCGASRPVGDEP